MFLLLFWLFYLTSLTRLLKSKLQAILLFNNLIKNLDFFCFQGQTFKINLTNFANILKMANITSLFCLVS